MLSITLKIAVDAPIPSASVSTAITANPGVLRRFLTAYRMSCPNVSMFIPPFTRSPLRSTPTSGARGPPYPVEAGFSPALCSGGSFDPLLFLSHLRPHPPFILTPGHSKSCQIFETRPTNTHPSSRLPNNGYPYLVIHILGGERTSVPPCFRTS